MAKYTMTNPETGEVLPERTFLDRSKMGRYASRTKNSYNHKALRARKRRRRKHGS